jgi:hypothetical protein
MTKFIETRDGEHINAALIECLTWSNEKGCYVAETTSGTKYHVTENNFLQGTATFVPNALDKKAYQIQTDGNGTELFRVMFIGWWVKASNVHNPTPIFSTFPSGDRGELFAIEASDGLYEVFSGLDSELSEENWFATLDEAQEYSANEYRRYEEHIKKRTQQRSL